MSGPFKRRASLKALPAVALANSVAMRRRSSLGIPRLVQTNNAQREVPWDMVDRCLLPVVFCHAAAVILSTVLNTLHISQISTLTLFIWFTISTIAAVLFYHNLKVTAAGKAVLITGCDSRIGYAIARYLDEQGFTVFAGFQNAVDNPFADDLKEESSGRLHILQLDVSSETQILAGSLYIVEHLPDGAPGLWAVIHGASYVSLGEIEWMPPQVIKKSTDINFLGATRVNQVMLPLIRRANGRIVFITSGLCKVSSPVRGIHCGLMAAIEAQANCLRQELRSRGVDVVVVAPGEFTSGSAWLFEENLLEQARDMWATLSQEQRGVYTEEYFETAIRSLEKFTKTQNADLSQVLRALADSIVRTFPLPRYTPVTRQEKVQALIADHLPRSFYAIIYK